MLILVDSIKLTSASAVLLNRDIKAYLEIIETKKTSSPIIKNRNSKIVGRIANPPRQIYTEFTWSFK